MLRNTVLKQLAAFDRLPAEDVSILAQMLREETVPDGTVLMREGEPGEFLVLVLEGTVEIIKALGTAEEWTIGVRGPGEIVGEMSLINDEQGRVASVRTKGEVRLGRLSRAQCDLLLQRRPTLAFEVMRVMSERLRQTDEAIIGSLQEKNGQLREAYAQLQEAQARLLAQERVERERQLALARYEHEMRLARRIQQSMLPAQLPSPVGWQIAVRYQPAYEVGGDFYDFLQVSDDRLWLAVGDVSGKGVPAALVMATTRSTLRGVMQQAEEPGMVLRRANDLLCAEMPAAMFVTCLVAMLNLQDGVLRYANAGHSLPFMARGEHVTQLEAKGMPLGLMTGLDYEEAHIVLQKGDKIVFYSDGLLEARNVAGEMFGAEGIRQQLQADSGVRGEGQLARLLEAVATFAGRSWEQEDDITLMSLSWPA